MDGYACVCFTILEAVAESQVYLRGKSYEVAVNALWNENGIDLFDIHFKMWGLACRNKEIQKHVIAILDKLRQSVSFFSADSVLAPK